MSITFWAPEAPTRVIHHAACDGDSGWDEEVSALPELNMAHANARSFLQLMGLPDEDCGRLRVDEFAPYIERALVLLNDESARASALREGCDSRAVRVLRDGPVPRIEPGARFIDCGLQDHQVQRYARTFLDLLTQAAQHDYDVSWG